MRFKYIPSVASVEPDVEAMKECIAMLLEKVDDYDLAFSRASRPTVEINGVKVCCQGDHTMHSFGQTPDWYVEAAFLAAYGQTSSEVNSTANKEARRIKDSWEV
jgi:hypothetical protein